MENTLSVSLMIAFLLIGAVGGLVLSPEKVIEVEIEKEVFVDVPIEVEVEKLVADSSEYLNLAVDDFMDHVDDNESFLTCVNHEYDFDEISIVRVYDDWSLSFDDEDYTVDFSIKLKYDEDDERSCKESYDVSVYYEEDENAEFNVFLA